MMTREEIGEFLLDADLGQVLMFQGICYASLRARLTMLRDRPEMARREAESLDDMGIRDVRTTFDHASWSGVPGGKELLEAVAAEALARGL